jgi:gamma-glutamylcyclotransferase (GGCT)/AIG2-like uncharacterized protein YtfP
VVASRQGGDIVRGELYRLAPSGRLLRQLDTYEGYARRAPARSLFVRQRVLAHTVGRSYPAWVYCYNRPLQRAARIASGDYRLVEPVRAAPTPA